MTIGQAIEAFDRLAAPGTMYEVGSKVADGGLALTRLCFATSTDPYGVAWPDLKRPRPGGPVEVRSGGMRDGAFSLATTSGARFVIPAPQAGFQHWGTVTNPQRRLLPVGWLGLPRTWVEMVRKSFVSTSVQRLGFGAAS